MNIDTLTKLYIHELKDLYSAENQIIDALPDMIDAAHDEDLKTALRNHREETQNQVNRIERIFQSLDGKPTGHKCKGVAGLVAEGNEVLKDVDDEAILDAAIIGACQRIEHYEIAGYGVARAFARMLGREDDVELLTETIEEEGAADKLLTRIAEHHINLVAARQN